MNFAEQYGPWAVVAGASEGTGRAFARKLAAKGIPSILIARRAEPLAALAKEIHAETGVACVTACVDMYTSEAPKKIIAAAGNREIGLYIANAGADVQGARFFDRPISDWLDHVHLNVMTTLQCCHHFGGLMRARQKGGIILVNSGACYGGASFMATYSASKAFVLNLGESLWADLHPQGVDVLNLILTQTDTPAFRKMLADKGMALPTKWATAEEVAEVGLARLPHGPTYNWGQEDDVVGYAPISAAARRARLLAVDEMSKAVFGKG
ncbi:MAG: SDR family NAD(P)-dependent oxidoreductase [Rhodospirillaceae bacterium]|nr:MAG: SDR family NAD(P)-dependent oxidoreductase [Rhodospirillaceae bacterium]